MTPRWMVCSGDYTIVLLVLFGGWSAQAFTHDSYLSFSADGLLFGLTQSHNLTHDSFSADGLLRRLHNLFGGPSFS